MRSARFGCPCSKFKFRKSVLRSRRSARRSRRSMKRSRRSRRSMKRSRRSMKRSRRSMKRSRRSRRTRRSMKRSRRSRRSQHRSQHRSRVRIIVSKEHSLSKHGYSTTKSSSERHRSLSKAVKEYGYGPIMKKLNAVYVLNRNKNPKMADKMQSDKIWLRKTYRD